MAAVVDPRRQFVGDQTLVGHEEQLDGQRPGDAHHHGQALADGRGTFGDLGIERCRREALDEDPLVVPVAREWERRDAPDRAPRDDDRDLRREGQLGLGKERFAGRPADPLDGAIDLRRVVQAQLTATVVATGRDLQA